MNIVVQGDMVIGQFDAVAVIVVASVKTATFELETPSTPLQLFRGSNFVLRDAWRLLRATGS
ncbi:MAG: hypothetical protein ACOX5J_17895 [Candidatus Hydrogenedentales bacterium]